MTPKPKLRVTLFPPNGAPMVFRNCEIESIILPDLSFRGAGTGRMPFGTSPAARCRT